MIAIDCKYVERRLNKEGGLWVLFGTSPQTNMFVGQRHAPAGKSVSRPCCAKCIPWTTGSLLAGPTQAHSRIPGITEPESVFNKTYRWSVHTLRFKKHWSKHVIICLWTNIEVVSKEHSSIRHLLKVYDMAAGQAPRMQLWMGGTKSCSHRTYVLLRGDR